MMNNQQKIDPNEVAWWGRFNVPGILNNKKNCILVKLKKDVPVKEIIYSYIMINKAYLDSKQCSNRDELIAEAEKMRQGNFTSAMKSQEVTPRITEIGKLGDWWVSFDTLKNSLPKDSKIPDELTSLLKEMQIKRNKTIYELLSATDEEISEE